VQAEPIDAALKKRLVSAMADVVKALDSGRGNPCAQLGDIVSTVERAGKKLTASQAQRILTDLARIRTVVGC
jgi:hypothetical protein